MNRCLKETLAKTMEKLSWVSESAKGKIPYTTINGVYDDRASMDMSKCDRADGINWWCNGFWAGMLWMMYSQTHDERYADIARLTERKLDACFDLFYGLHHDVGFMWLPSAVNDYRLTGDKDARRRAFHAATLLAGRFNPVGRFIRAWNELPNGDDTRGWAIIDCMLNIPILYWASEESGDPRFRQIAMMHADTVMKAFIREDGSVRHIVEFDPNTGDVVRDYGGQGYAQGSSWTRGQAWGLYGFMMSYAHTGEQRYLDTAIRIARYFLANIPEDGLIPVDFDQPAEPDWHDDTAAAIAACGLLDIAKAVEAGDVYREAAEKLLCALGEHHCDFSRDTESILQKCSGAYHSAEHEYSIIYGDFFFLEALLKCQGNDHYMW